MIKVAFSIIVFNGDYVLPQVLETVIPFATQVLVSEGPVRYWQECGYSTSSDLTNTILDNFPNDEGKIKVYHGQFKEKTEQANAVIPYLRDDIDIIWNLDSDELFHPEHIDLVLKLINDKGYNSAGFRSNTFWAGFDRILGKFEQNSEFIRIRRVNPKLKPYWWTHRPPTIAHRYGNIDYNNHLSFDVLDREYGVRMHHMSYTFPRQVATKVEYYENFLINRGDCIPNFFENVYLKWINSTEEQRKTIEQRWAGCHEFMPHARTECYTEPFTGKYPPVIERDMEDLKEKFDEQLKVYNNFYGFTNVDTANTSEQA